MTHAIGVFNGNWKNQWADEKARRDAKLLPENILPHERNMYALYVELRDLIGETAANEFGRSLTGQGYDEQCAAYVKQIDTLRSRADANKAAGATQPEG